MTRLLTQMPVRLEGIALREQGGVFSGNVQFKLMEKQMIRYKRQHGVAAALVVACGILFWQCWSLWGEQPATVKVHTAVVKPNVVVEKAMLGSQKPDLPVIQSSPLPPLTPAQQRYLQLANDLRLAHLERALAEEQGALQAKTNQKTAIYTEFWSKASSK